MLTARRLGFPRVALHAAALTFIHPTTQKSCVWKRRFPLDMESLISDKLIIQQ